VVANLERIVTEYKVCQRCGTVHFYRNVLLADSITQRKDKKRFNDMCDKCYGEVKWQLTPEVQQSLSVKSFVVVTLLFIILTILLFYRLKN
jgi:hypothetical protein